MGGGAFKNPQKFVNVVYEYPHNDRSSLGLLFILSGAFRYNRLFLIVVLIVKEMSYFLSKNLFNEILHDFPTLKKLITISTLEIHCLKL